MAAHFQIAKSALGLTTESNKNVVFSGREGEIVLIYIYIFFSFPFLNLPYYSKLIILIIPDPQGPWSGTGVAVLHLGLHVCVLRAIPLLQSHCQVGVQVSILSSPSAAGEQNARSNKKFIFLDQEEASICMGRKLSSELKTVILEFLFDSFCFAMLKK